MAADTKRNSQLRHVIMMSLCSITFDLSDCSIESLMPELWICFYSFWRPFKIGATNQSLLLPCQDTITHGIYSSGDLKPCTGHVCNNSRKIFFKKSYNIIMYKDLLKVSPSLLLTVVLKKVGNKEGIMHWFAANYYI